MNYKYTIILLIVTILIALYLVFGHNGILKYKEMVDIRVKYETKIEELEDRLQVLEGELEDAQTDRTYLESVIRRELGLVKNDEDLYVIMDNATDNKSGNK